MDPTLQATLRSLFSSAFNLQPSQKALEKALEPVNKAIDDFEDHYKKEQAERASTISEIESSWEETVRKMRERAKLEPETTNLTEDLIAIGNEHMAKLVKLKGN